MPAKEHAWVVRISEAVLDAYIALRQGNVVRGMARLTLLLAAMEESVLKENGISGPLRCSGFRLHRSRTTAGRHRSRSFRGTTSSGRSHTSARPFDHRPSGVSRQPSQHKAKSAPRSARNARRCVPREVADGSFEIQEKRKDYNGRFHIRRRSCRSAAA